MPTLDYFEQRLLRSKRTYGTTVGLTFCVLGITVVIGWLLARTLIRDQIIRRDADLLYAATLMEQTDARTGNAAAALKTDAQIGFDAAILASRMKGVIGIRFFDRDGRFTDSFPATIQPRDLQIDTLNAVRRLEPHSRYDGATPMTDVFIYRTAFATGRVDRIPTLAVTVPLHQEGSATLFGAAQFIVEGHTLATQFRALDRHLAGLAGQTLLIAGTLLGLMLWLALRRLERLDRQLAAKNRDLSRANEELAMAARTSALGAVSAHLMHGLKNPLASLSRYVRDQNADDAPHPRAEETEDWQDAVAAARRMQSLVDHTMEVLADARGGPLYEVRWTELADRIRTRVGALAQRRSVSLAVRIEGDGTLSSRTANLAELVMVNLTENAIQATPAGKQVTLQIRPVDSGLRFSVSDEGPGFPDHLRPRIFLPCKSTREGGSGIGLSICKHLADHLGAKLELAEVPGGGCTFTFELPGDRLVTAIGEPAAPHATSLGR